MAQSNFDGAWDERSKRGVGVVIRDNDGIFIAGLAGQLELVASPLLVELFAARRVVTLCRDKFPGGAKFIFGGDACTASCGCFTKT